MSNWPSTVLALMAAVIASPFLTNSSAEAAPRPFQRSSRLTPTRQHQDGDGLRLISPRLGMAIAPKQCSGRSRISARRSETWTGIDALLPSGASGRPHIGPIAKGCQGARPERVSAQSGAVRADRRRSEACISSFALASSTRSRAARLGDRLASGRRYPT
jgi:hypothetical protein